MSDLYDVLGVPREATPAQIRKAYRELSKEVHPDLGGDPVEFEKIAEANRVLSNQDLRAQYDKDGSIGSGLDNVESEALNLITSIFHGIVHDCIENNVDVADIDIVGGIRQALANGAQSLSREIEQQLGRKKVFEKTLKRWKGIQGENYFEAAARQMMQQLERNVVAHETELARGRLAMAKLQGVTYDHLKKAQDRSPTAGVVFKDSLGEGWNHP